MSRGKHQTFIIIETRTTNWIPCPHHDPTNNDAQGGPLYARGGVQAGQGEIFPKQPGADSFHVAIFLANLEPACGKNQVNMFLPRIPKNN